MNATRVVCIAFQRGSGGQTRRRVVILDDGSFAIVGSRRYKRALREGRVKYRTVHVSQRKAIARFLLPRGYTIGKWTLVEPFPWLVVAEHTRLPKLRLVIALNEIARRCKRKLRMNEGLRTREQQQAYWDAAVKRYGSEYAANRWVARPGTSRHETGDAADMVDALDNENLRPMMERRGMTAAQFGLVFPMSWEPWHIEIPR